MEVSRDHLTVVLNALFDAGETTIPVRHPCEDIGELLRIELNTHSESTVRFTQGAMQYRQRRDDVRRRYGDEPYEDLPGHNEYVKAAVAGGLLPPENEPELRAFLDRHTYPDLAAGHDPVMLALDTNLFGFRIPEILDLDPQTGNTDERDRTPTNGYVLSGGVKAELDWHYKRFETRPLEDAFGEEIARLRDQPAGANRLGFLGLYEYRRRLANRSVDLVPSDTGDAAIVDAYAEYDETHRKRAVVLSNDYGFIDRAREADLSAHHVAVPVDLPRTVTTSWEDIATTLSILAVMFGVLVLPKVTLYGVWTGKSGLEWQREQLDVDVRSPIVEPQLDRDLSLVEEFATISHT